jgi:hypothetical protein
MKLTPGAIHFRRDKTGERKQNLCTLKGRGIFNRAIDLGGELYPRYSETT